MGEGTTAPSLLDRLLRPGRGSSRDVVVDLTWLLGLGLILMGAGIGLRDPWPADEPRFALVAQDMLRSSDWLIPRVGGDIYADKPPFYFWLMAAAMAATGSLRIGFLLPSLLAGLGTVVLVYDLLRRLRGREVALAGGLLLLLTFQFVWQARQAQIDATLCFLTTLSLYGLLRHLALGPARGWFLAGWAAAGLGVITKGVGFLPLLILVPFALLSRRGWPTAARTGWLGIVGLLCMLAAIGVWLVPMLVASSAGGELAAYRDEILFQQTVTRYAEAWHHNEPFWYYLVSVIPVLWLPLIALVPWLWSRWRQAIRERDTVNVALLVWVLLVVLFFSSSSGKRGVYVLPAVPALAMAAAPWLPELLRTRGTRRLAFSLASLLAAVTAAAALSLALVPSCRSGCRRVRRPPRALPGRHGRGLRRVAGGVPGARWLARVRRGVGGRSGHDRPRDLPADQRRALVPGVHGTGRAGDHRHSRARAGRGQGAVPAAGAASNHHLWPRTVVGEGSRGGRRSRLARGW